jgi:hypothetical protein
MTDQQPTAPASLPPGVVWDGTNWRYGAQVWDGTTWSGAAAPRSSTGRTVAGVLCLVVAAVAILIGWGWVTGYMDLEAQGNDFAGLLILLVLGAAAVAAGFGITGLVLLSPKR